MSRAIKTRGLKFAKAPSLTASTAQTPNQSSLPTYPARTTSQPTVYETLQPEAYETSQSSFIPIQSNDIEHYSQFRHDQEVHNYTTQYQDRAPPESYNTINCDEDFSSLVNFAINNGGCTPTLDEPSDISNECLDRSSEMSTKPRVVDRTSANITVRTTDSAVEDSKLGRRHAGTSGCSSRDIICGRRCKFRISHQLVDPRPIYNQQGYLYHRNIGLHSVSIYIGIYINRFHSISTFNFSGRRKRYRTVERRKSKPW
ncbi:hypothetical protein EGW08_021951 [Elysia chlorotica]|uniref:Uncharacterized protein n=1 Tax=Elysia chlorotica TaxID=188477 RepID=A0A433SM72_ELYCH|nr:hypothetical protein EGW08_021951 [Elysia chlorotica]